MPQLSDILSRLLPVLSSVKLESLRVVFAQGAFAHGGRCAPGAAYTRSATRARLRMRRAAMGQFCEAILAAVHNIERSADRSISTKDYSGQVFSAFEIMFNVWMTQSDTRVRLAVVESLGQMSLVMERAQFEAQLPKMLPAVIALYKKHTDQLPITRGICNILNAAVLDGSRVLEPMLENLMNSLQPYVFVQIDYTNPSSVKNHNELLRCFEIMCRVFSDRVVAFLIQRLEQPNAKNRIGT